ncbi:MAG TPA: hypothetical protein VJ788_07785, partial [Gemmatimonadota bacterium]|nr:hypothetical protein [Gemmatimonadota bacterium]
MPHPFFPALGRSIIPALAMVSIATTARAQDTPAGSAELTYFVDVQEGADDRFRVRLAVDGLPAGSEVIQFAATAPGTYQVMDVGRFLEGLRATDASGSQIPIEQISTN